MSAPFNGWPPAANPEQAILLSQLMLLRRLDPARADSAERNLPSILLPK